MYVCVFFRSYGKEREREGERERDRERNKRAREMLTGVTDVREWWHTRTRMFPQIAFATPIRSRPFPPPSGSLSSPPLPSHLSPARFFLSDWTTWQAEVSVNWRGWKDMILLFPISNWCPPADRLRIELTAIGFRPYLMVIIIVVGVVYFDGLTGRMNRENEVNAGKRCAEMLQEMWIDGGVDLFWLVSEFGTHKFGGSMCLKLGGR